MAVDLELGNTRLLIAEGRAYGLLRNQLAYVLATALWETNFTVEPVAEAYYLGEPAATEYRATLRYSPWYGRGYVGLTWEDNYRRADEELELHGNLIADPDLALEVGIAARVIVHGMVAGWFTGLTLADFITLQRSDFVGARAIVNGSDHATDIAELAVEYDEALLAWGYGVDDGADPIPPDWNPNERPLHRAAVRKVLRELADRSADQAQEISDMESRLDDLENWARGFAG